MQWIDDARQWWRLRSNQLALIAGPLMAVAVEHRAELSQLIAPLPPLARVAITVTLFTVLPLLARNTKQKDSANG